MSMYLAPDGEPRCGWAGSAPEFLAYHDAEWGTPIVDDVRLFEKLCLEGFQSGLSWRTILAKREGFRSAFAGFEPHLVADYGDDDVARLLGDAGIVRHRGKIEAVVNNARRAIDLQEEAGSLAAYFWGFEPDPDEVALPQTVSTSPTSIALSKDLKKRGWKFVGPTTVFAFMQATGIVNDHATDCVVRPVVDDLRRKLVRPKGRRPR